MVIYDRSEADEYRVIDEYDGGVGWYAHPDEDGKRASHALAAEDGVWLLDPLDAPDIGSAFADLGTVRGVVVCSAYHTRDAETFADRYDVPVFFPEWISGVSDSIQTTVERFDEELATNLRAFECTPFRGWEEAILYRPADGTLYVPDSLGTGSAYTPGPESIGPPPFRRLNPPRFLLTETDPNRILCGHGDGVHTDPVEALKTCFDGCERRLPSVLWHHGSDFARAVYEVMTA